MSRTRAQTGDREDEDGIGVGIDHVELTVRDRESAADWFREVLGLTPVAELEEWATAGPLMLSNDGGRTKLALFEAESGDGNEVSGRPTVDRVAFGVVGEEFLALVDHLADRPDVDVTGREDIVDHDRSFSVYFTGPSGNRFEVTTYDYGTVASRLAGDG
jgi:catechol 2,3-dioxygenase-like lactoylglutathione lyase family enzyme